MNLRRTTFAAPVVFALLAGCGGQDDPAPANTGGAAAGGTNPTAGGSGGSGTGGGMSAAGSSAGGGGAMTGVAGVGAGTAGMTSAAGTSGGGAGGPSAAGAAGADSTAGSSGNSSAIAATFDTVKLVLGGGGGIMPCAAAPCHGVGGKAPPDDPLELPPNDDQQLYTNLTSHVSKACNNTKVVDPGNPAQSALVTILSGPCGKTPRMPYGCDPQSGNCIPDEYIAAVKQWIANGAPQP